jgi:hypothetical protein
MSNKHWIAALLLPGLLVATRLTAQEARPPDPPPEPRRLDAASIVPQSAVGNRQPRSSDLSARPQQDELGLKIEQINRTLERTLQICRGC